MELLELFNNTLLNGFSHKIVTSSKNIFPGFYQELSGTQEEAHGLAKTQPFFQICGACIRRWRGPGNKCSWENYSVQLLKF